MLNKKDFTIGFDPEFLLKDTILNKHVSGLDYNFGDKNNGKEICPNCTVENDMVTIEMVLPPVTLLEGVEEAWENYETVKNLIEDELPSHIKLDCCSYAEFTEEELSHDKAREGGCSIDFNAWENGLPNPKPKFNTPYRSSGAHIHFGNENMKYIEMMHLVMLGDLFISVPLVLNQSNTERRKLYGKAGAFRCVQGRVELRSPSNCYWESIESLKWVFNQIEKLIDYYNEKGISEIEEEKERILSAINEDNLDSVYYLIEKFQLDRCPLPEIV